MLLTKDKILQNKRANTGADGSPVKHVSSPERPWRIEKGGQELSTSRQVHSNQNPGVRGLGRAKGAAGVGVRGKPEFKLWLLSG